MTFALSRPVVGALALNITSAGLMYALHIILARLMGPENYGVYAVAITWATVLVIVAKAGLDIAIVRFIAVYEAENDAARTSGLIRFSVIVCIAISVPIIAGGWLFLNSGYGPPADTSPYLVALFMVPAWGILHLFQAGLRGLSRIPQHEIADRAFRPTAIICAVLLLANLVGESITPKIATTVQLWATVAALALAAILFARACPSGVRPGPARFEGPAWMATALPLAVTASMHLLLANVDVIMVGALDGTEAAGIYSVAARVAVLSIFLLTAVNAVVAPRFARLHAAGDTAAIQSLARHAALAGTLFAVLVAGGLVALAPWVLGWFGDGFEAGSTALAILCAAHVVNAACGSVGVLLSMTRHERDAARILMTALGLNIVANGVLIPVWGIDGAAVATGLSTVYWNIAMVVIASRKLGINAAVVSLPSIR